MNAPFTPPAAPPTPPRTHLVHLVDGRIGLVLDADARGLLRGIANGLAISGAALLTLAALVAAIRWGIAA